MSRNGSEVIQDKDDTVRRLLSPEHYVGTDWFTKLAKVEEAKAFRRESQKSRKGKPLTVPRISRRLRSR